MAASSLTSLPFRLLPLSKSSSSSKSHHQHLFPSPPLKPTNSISTPSSHFGFGSVAFHTRSIRISPLSSSSDENNNEAEASTTVQTLEEPSTENEEEEVKPLRPPIIKLGNIMGILNKKAVEAAELERPVPDLRTGDIVQIKLEVPENRRRASLYKGIIISKQNAGIHTTIRIRRIIAGIGVEIVFPIYSPNIKEIKVVKHRKVRRARLYYLRDKLPRLSTFK